MKRVLLICFSLLLSHYAYAVGEISMLRGKAQIMRGNAHISAKIQMHINNKDQIQTQDGSKLQITFKDNTVITLGSNTLFSIADYLFEEQKSKADFQVKSGSFKVITGKIGKLAPKSFLLKTKTSLIGIRGTIFSGEVGNEDADNQGDLVACLKGQIEVSSLLTGKSQLVNHGEMLMVNNDGALGEIKKLTPNRFNQLSHLQKSAKKKQTSSQTQSAQTNSEQQVHTSNITTENSTNISTTNPDSTTHNATDDEQSIKPSINKLIANKITVHYKGNLQGQVTGNHSSSISHKTSEYEANINADMSLNLDFGGNKPLEVNISNQNLTVNKVIVNGNTLTGNDLQSYQQQLNHNNNLQSNMKMQQTLNADNLSLTGRYHQQANGLVKNVELDAHFNNDKAEVLSGTLNESTKGTHNNVRINRTINSNFKVQQD